MKTKETILTMDVQTVHLKQTVPGEDKRLICGNTGLPQSGFTLLHCLVYIALLGFLGNLSYQCYYRCLTSSKYLERNARDISRTLHAGEIWREDIRMAVASPRIHTLENQTVLVIPHKSITLWYWLEGTAIWKSRNEGVTKERFLELVQESDMQAEDRNGLTAWKWEVVLAQSQKVVRLPGIFTFYAVPGPKQQLSAMIEKTNTLR